MQLTAAILGVAQARPWCLGSLSTELVPVVNRPLLLRQLDVLRKAGVEQVALVSDRMIAGEVERAFAAAGGAPMDLSYILVPPEATQAERLLAAQTFLSAGEAFVVQPGGTLVEHDVRASLAQLAARGLHAVAVDPRGPRTARRAAELRQLDVAGPPPLGFSPALLVCDGSIFDAVHEAGEHMDLAGAVVALDRQSGKVEIEPVSGWSEQIDGVDDLLEANRRALDRMTGAYEAGSIHESNVLGPVCIAPEARVEFSLVRGPVAIASHARVSDAYVGPYTCIGDAAVIERVEMESCVILPGALVENLPARLEGSLIGENAQVFRRPGLPHALRLTVGADALLSLT